MQNRTLSVLGALGVLLLTVPCCKVLARAVVAYVDSFADGPSGRVRKVGETVGGEQQGDWEFFYAGGAKMAAGPYRDDKPFGEWQYWYENGQPESRGSYGEDGGRTGLWTYHHDNGAVSARGHFSHDTEHGPWTYLDRDGQRQHGGCFDRGRRTGVWTSWHDDGTKSAEGCYHDGERIGPWRLFTASGEPSLVEHPVPAGADLWYELWPDGTPRRLGMMIDGARSGTWVSWHRNGEPRLVCSFDRGAPAGSWAGYRADGTPLADGAVAGGILDDWRIWTAQSSAPQTRQPLPQIPPLAGDDWAQAGLIETAPPATVVATWLAELRGPKLQRSTASPTARSATPEQVAALQTDPRVAPAPQPAWTERETEEYDAWVEAYSTGTKKRSGLGRRYGPARRSQSSKDSNRDELLHAPCPFQELQPVDGPPVRLADYRGKKKVLVTVMRGFFGEVCVYCVAQTKALAKYRARLAELGTEVLVVYPGPRHQEKAFREACRNDLDEPPPYTVCYDAELALVEQIGISGGHLAYPTTLLLDEDGVIQYAYTGAHRADRPPVEDIIKVIEKLED